MLLLSAALAVAFASIVAIGVAGGGVKTKASINSSASAFYGKVRSNHRPCRRNRVVKVFRNRIDQDPRLVGKDRSNRRGKWKVRTTVRPGAYFAVVKRRVVHDVGAGTVCKRGFSMVHEVPGR